MSSNGKNLLVVDGKGMEATSVELWDIHSSAFVRKLELGVEKIGPFVSNSPDARKLGYTNNGFSVHIYNLDTNTRLSSEPQTGGYIYVVGWSSNSDRLLTCTEKGNARVWRVTDSSFEPITDTIQLDCSYYPPQDTILYLGDKIIYLNRRRKPVIGHLENRQLQTQVLQDPEDYRYPYALSPDHRMFACGTRDQTSAIIRDAASGNIIGGPIKGGEKKICSLSFSPDGKQLVSLHHFTDIRIWDVESVIEQYRVANPQTEANTSSALNEGPSSSTPPAPANTLRARSNSADSSILNLPISDVDTPSATLSMSMPTQTPYTRRREARKPIEYDSLLDLPATDVPIRPCTQNSPSDTPESSPAPQRSGNPPEAAAITPSAPGHSQLRARFTALWARIRRRRKPGPTPERGSRAHKNNSKSESIPMRDLSDAPVPAPAPAQTDDSGIMEVAAGRLDDRLIIAPPRKKKKLPVSPPLQAAENVEVQPASQSNASSSSSSSGSSSSQTDSDAESIDWLDYLCFCMCLPSNKMKKKRRKEKEKAGRRS
ncbi:quinon protein alcohol dehydrogenase-like superfamily [Hygrophoropsis aurantiaca]|uniref:Quinon protein alcohol dehydrogenase-like superfamily n=1 Tax=Hygrophoropsis aurantiaca TaxID=72124 RepID=A0ACB8ABJ6_9AGAM|nr:quinon protein alcohol dehydrogenase-like superfamily [Hygrophoropsis aurantiaca]